MDDAKEFRETQYALTLLGVGSKEHGYKLICSITPKIYYDPCKMKLSKSLSHSDSFSRSNTLIK